MRNIIENYDYVLLDFSVLFTEASENVLKNLNEATNVIVSPTFFCECNHIQKVVPYQIEKWYKKNVQKISIDSKKIYDKFGVTDTFDLARYLMHDYSVLIIEANYSLEDRIILSGLYIDIYSLFEYRLIQYENYESEIKHRTMDINKTPLNYFEVKTGSHVFTKKDSYVLADVLNSGVEAKIYKISNNAQILAKIYKEDEDGNSVLTLQKLNNINNLKEINDNWDVLWMALPNSVLYADPECEQPIGYTMKYFDEISFFSEIPLFSEGDISAKFPMYNDITIKYVLDICIKFVQQVLFLSISDIRISDYNDKNFAIRIRSDSKILMVDTDSYCCENYISDCITYADNLSQKYEHKNRLDIINICDESLYAFIFTRLMLDSSFGPMRKSEFRFSDSKMATLKNPNIKAKWRSVPQNLQNLFTNIFADNKTPSISVLLYELESAYCDDFSNTKYIDIYKDILKIITDHTIKTSEKSQREIQQDLTMPPPFSAVFSNSSKSSQLKEKMLHKLLCIFKTIVILFCFLLWCLLFPSSCCTTQNLNSTNELDPEITGGNKLGIEMANIELQRYGTDDGYYLSYSSDLNGYVEYYWNNGDTYKGNFINGVKTGNGIFEWSNGIKYDGEWNNGLFNGEGTYVFPNGGSYSNTWSQGTCKSGAYVELFFNKSEPLKPAAKGYWSENTFFGSYYQDGQWYDLP